MPHTDLLPSRWLQRWVHLLRPGARVLDVACGSGRHLRWLAERGFAVTGVDRDAAALSGLLGLGETVVADLEANDWPLPGRRFDLVLVTNYLWRPLQPALLASLADDGLYLHETFANGQQTVGRPSRAEFLLQPGELLTLVEDLRIVAYEDGFEAGAQTQGPRYVQRIVAARPGAALHPRWPLPGGAGPGG